MADKKKNESPKIEAFYEWLANEIREMKTTMANELKLSSAQIGYLYKGITEDKQASSAALTQEIRYSYKQNQNIYEGLSVLLKKEVAERMNTVEEKIAALDQLQAILSDLGELKYSCQQLQTIYEGLTQMMEPKLDAIVGKDEMITIVDESTSVHSQKILDALANAPAPETVDYARISEEVGEKLLETLNAVKASEAEVAEEVVEEAVEVVDYERIAGDTAAKVIESMPYAEPVDYNRIDESVATAVAEAVNEDVIKAAVSEVISTEAIASAISALIDVDAIAEAVAAKIAIPVPEVNYDELAEAVVGKLAEKGISADVILDDEGIEKIAETVADKVGTAENVDYDRVAEIVDEKLAASNEVIEKVVTLDDDGIEKIVSGVADELRNMTLVCECTEELEEVAEEATEEVAEPVVEEIVEEVVEEVAEEIVEETVEETVEVVEEPVVEEVVEEAVEEPVAEEAPVAETPVEEEIAAALERVYEEDMNGQLVDAETGLVVRLKRSFTAKMKQSEEQVKVYYSDIKNALTSYKKINSNVSWHGDRFNYGRETVAKIGINGKTLCFYLALDPNDPELKTTVYHQKDVGAQKAYESTPFMVKVKSEAASKKALRLVGILAEKLGAVHDESFEEVDYVAEYAYESTKQLFEEGDIKATKEKKVDFNF